MNKNNKSIKRKYKPARYISRGELSDYICIYSEDEAMKFYHITFADVQRILYGIKQRKRTYSNPHPDVPTLPKPTSNLSEPELNYRTMIRNEMSKPEMVLLIKDLNSYAAMAICRLYYKALQGMAAEDFVSNVLLKVLEGTRIWKPENIKWKSFLFGCVKSEISSYKVGLVRHEFQWTGKMEPDLGSGSVRFTK